MMGAAQIWSVMAFAMSLVPVSLLVNRIVPNPYMDEIFHIPQAQQYCRGNFHDWDPMITTFPGLYILSLMYTSAILPAAQLLGIASSITDLCNPAVLRSINVALLLVCFCLFVAIVQHLEPQRSAPSALLKACVLSLYPLHWFFGFLYYTDVGSTTAVMAMHLAGLKQAYWISSLLAAIAILFRQTNVVWAIFVTCAGVLEILKFSAAPTVETQEDDVVSYSKRVVPRDVDGSQISKTRRRKGGRISLPDPAVLDPLLNQKVSSGQEDQGIIQEVIKLAKLAWVRRRQLLWSFGPLLMVILTFVAFVIHNGSIVVGAKDAHKVSPHFAQIWYFGLVSALAMAPINFSPGHVLDFTRQFQKPKAWFFTFVGCFTAYFCIRYFSFAHPYLLADNRHYTFYLWKNVIRSHWSAKYCLIPLYIYSWWSTLHSIGKKEGRLWIVVLVVGIAGVLVPAPLIEFRYYTIPIFLFALHIHVPKDCEILTSSLLAIAYIGVDAVTMYLFLYRPFQWAHEPEGVQRFIW